MTHIGSGQMQMQGPPPTGWCDYCQQKPKFPPYNYCGKVCGARARATGSIPANGPVMCKQCGQKPVYKGHQFCGRNCANTWQAMYGQINTGGRGQPQHGQQSWNQVPPPYTQNPPSNSVQPSQGFNQGGGIMNFVRGLVSPSQQPQPPQQPQQRSGPSNPQYTQQVPGPTSPNPMMISPPITPMSSGGSLKSLGMGGPMSSGMFDPMSPGTPTPTTPGLNQQYYSPSSPTSPGIQDPNANNQANGQHFWSPPLPSPHISKQNPTPGQKSTTMSMAMNSQMISAGGGGNQSSRDLNFDPNQSPTTSNNYPNSNQFPVPVQAQAQAQLSVQSTSTSSGPATTCRLKGCDKSASAESEYCSQRHREEAKLFGQVNPCIMCLKMPRGLTDHFCSKACRDKALSP